jgi:3-oxoisoapionate kinase
MNEADLRVHLSKQTDKTIGLVDLVMLGADDADDRVDAVLSQGSQIIMFDVADVATQKSVGRQLCRRRSDQSLYAVGSSGLEYALLDEWARLDLISGRSDFAEPGPVERIAVVSGSCSPTTERQIRHAEGQGFEGFAIDPKALALGRQDAIDDAIGKGCESLARGRSVILYTALGPDTDIGAQLANAGARHAIGRALGRIERALIERAGLRRVVIAGGDTSSHALSQLGIYALTMRMPLLMTPGSPLCIAHSDLEAFDGLEIALKGGQVGGDDYFSQIKQGLR